MNLILDASVVIKWFAKHQEQDRKQAIYIRNQLVQGKLRIIVPDLIYYEIMNVLRLKRYIKNFDLQIIANTLFRYPFEIIYPSEELMKNALNTASEYAITIYDATYITIAQKFGCPLITADRKISQSSPKTTVLLGDFKIE